MRPSMIGRLTGKVSMQADGAALVDVSGVGYEVLVPLGALGRASADDAGRTTLFIHTHAREDALTLFGFATDEDRSAFRTLIGVAGVGPKTALAVLGALPAESLSRAIAHKSVGELTQVPGIGKKTAERMCLELQGKLPQVASSAGPTAPVRPTAGKHDSAELLASALMRMGYRPAETDRTIVALGDRVSAAPLPELIREALAILSK
jgi:holliday junction DNA helicase RuvA